MTVGVLNVGEIYILIDVTMHSSINRHRVINKREGASFISRQTQKPTEFA